MKIKPGLLEKFVSNKSKKKLTSLKKWKKRVKFYLTLSNFLKDALI